MFSYRHVFHIGNLADVLKHSTLVACVKHLLLKEKPFMVLDTHAGAGKYSTTDPLGRNKMEWQSGLGKLVTIMKKKNYLPSIIYDYLKLVIIHNNGNQIKNIPGSPALASMLLRKNDRLWAFELHPSEFMNLEKNFSSSNKKVILEKSDGFISYRKLLPPISRRGLIFIDPSYENRNDYKKTFLYVKEGLKKFETGIFVIWLPNIQRYEVKKTLGKLKNLKIKNFYHVRVQFKKNKSNSLGLLGSNLVIINPPFGIEPKLDEVSSFMENTVELHE